MRRLWKITALLLILIAGAGAGVYFAIFRRGPPIPATGETLPGNLRSALQPAAFDWPQHRGPRRDGSSDETGWKARWEGKPPVLWEARVGTGASSMAISQGRLFTVGNRDGQDSVHCLNAETGESIWRFVYTCPLETRQFEGGPAATPTVDEDRVYILSHDGQLFCLDVTMGAQHWGIHVVADLGGDRPRWGFAGSPLVAGDRLIVSVGGRGSSTAALDKMTGGLIWKSGDDHAGYSSPVLFRQRDRDAVAVFKGDGLVALSLDDGALLWRHPWETSYKVNAATPLVAGERIFICSGYNRGAAVLDFSSGEPKPLWDNRSLRCHFSSSVLHEDHLYGVDDSGELRCVSFETGEIRWQQKGFGKGTIIRGGDKLIALSERGALITIEATHEAYREISRAPVLSGRCWVAPALAGGRIYVKDNDGHLVCLDVRG